MIAITQENTRNLPTSVKTTTEMVPFKLRKEAVGEAQIELGPEARPGFEFNVTKCDGGWHWRRVSVDECKAKLATNGAQLKANGGKKSLLAQAVAIETKSGTVPKEILAGAFEEVAAKIETVSIEKERSEARQLRALEEQAKLDTTEDKNGVPAFLKRAPKTAEQKEARVEKHKKTTGPGRVIKNPPNVADVKSESKKKRKTGASMASVIKDAILAGGDNAKALADVIASFPDCGYKESDIKWYRRKLEKEGKIKGASK